MIRKSYQKGFVSKPLRAADGEMYFIIRYRLRNADGGWTHKSENLRGLKGRKEARAILDQRIVEATNRKPEIVELTLRQFADDYWMPYLNRKNVKPSTLKSYNSGLTHHIMPLLGNMRLVDIAPLHVEQLVQAVQSKKGKSKVPLSPRTVRNVLAICQSIFSLAVDNDVIGRSPVRKKHKPKAGRSEKTSWSPEQVRAIIDAAPAQYRALFMTAALTGVRLGELLALRWLDVDFAAKLLRIEHSLWQGTLISPKTLGSVRRIPFGEALATVLRQHKDSFVPNAVPTDFVFSKANGEPLQPDVVRRDVLYPVLDRLQIGRKSRSSGFHSFRHSAGSVVNQETGNMKLAQKFLGHSNFSTTADVYVHTSADADREAALALERAIFGDLFVIVRDFTNNSPKSVSN